MKLASTAASSDEDESDCPIEYFIECSDEKNAVDLAQMILKKHLSENTRIMPNMSQMERNWRSQNIDPKDPVKISKGAYCIVTTKQR